MKKIMLGIVAASLMLSGLTACNKAAGKADETSREKAAESEEAEGAKATESEETKGTKAAPFELESEPDMDKLRELYPEFFDRNKPIAKGIEVYEWQMAEDSYSFGLMYGTNRAKEDEEIWDLQTRPLTLDEAKAILNECNVTRAEIFIIPVVQPTSSYKYRIDNAYWEKVYKLFE